MKAKTLTNTGLIEEVALVPQARCFSFKWTEHYEYLTLFTRKLKYKRKEWAWRHATPDSLYQDPDLRTEYTDDFELVKAHPEFKVINKALHVKAHITIRFASGKEITKWFPDDETAQTYWDREIATLPDFKDISEPKNYIDV